MPTYAADTKVTVMRSRDEIEEILQRYGADQFLYAWEPKQAIIGFRIAARQVKMVLPLPDRNDDEFMLTSQGRPRVATAAQTAWEQACRQRWRALALVIKAKLEAVECGISTIEREFLPDVVMPDGTTFHQWAKPQIEAAYLEGRMPSMIPAITARKE